MNWSDANKGHAVPRPDGRLAMVDQAFFAENAKPALRELAARVLAEFDLTGQID